MNTPHIVFSAGDASGDVHGAALARELRARFGESELRLSGMGGAAMSAAGVDCVVESRELAIGGFVELATSARRVRSVWRRMREHVARAQPDLVVLIDSGGFNLPFARRVRRTSNARILYFVAPQVWAWRSGRIRKIAARVDRLAVILPFEPELYAAHCAKHDAKHDERRGADPALRVDFVGHPLAESLAPAPGDRSRARRELGLPEAAQIVALFPGSRRNEVAAHLDVQLRAALRLHARVPGTVFAIAVAPSVDRARIDAAVSNKGLPLDVPLHCVDGRSLDVLRAADIVLAKPGSTTTEAMLLERPMVVMARAHPITAAIVRRALRVPYLAMPNLVAGEAIVPELWQGEATPERVAAALETLLEDGPREAQREALSRARLLLGGSGAAARTADIVVEMLGLAEEATEAAGIHASDGR